MKSLSESLLGSRPGPTTKDLILDWLDANTNPGNTKISKVYQKDGIWWVNAKYVVFKSSVETLNAGGLFRWYDVDIFNASDTNITISAGVPVLGRQVHLESNKKLTKLEGFDSSTKIRSLYLNGCKWLKTLAGLAGEIVTIFLDDVAITDLTGADCANGICCHHNLNLTSLKGCTRGLNLLSLENCPKLKSLDGPTMVTNVYMQDLPALKTLGRTLRWMNYVAHWDGLRPELLDELRMWKSKGYITSLSER